jgi:anti-anti-sigma regulatory factor
VGADPSGHYCARIEQCAAQSVRFVRRRVHLTGVVTRPDDHDDSADGNIPPLTVQLDVIRPAVPLLQASGVLIPATADTLLDHVDREIGNGACAIVRDLSGLAVLGVDAVPALVEVAQWAGEVDSGLYLVASNGIVTQALRTAGALDLFDVYGDVADAVAAMP